MGATLSKEEMQICKRVGIAPAKYLDVRAMILDSGIINPYEFLNDAERKALAIAGCTKKDAAAFLITRRDAENARIRESKQEVK